MLTVQIAFPLHTLPTEDDKLVYGALVFRVMRETVGEPSALLSGQADWLTGEIVPVALAVTYSPDLSRVDEMVSGLTVLAAMYGQPVVAVSLANVEFIGAEAPTWLSEPGFPSETEAARYPDADLDAWADMDVDLDALERELAAFYGDAPDEDEDEEHGVFVVTIGEASVSADEAPPEAE